MRECSNCERLKQRIADLNSELLVLKIAAYGSTHATPVVPADPELPPPTPEPKARAQATQDSANLRL